MEPERWERVAVSTGIAFVVLRLALYLAIPQPPQPAAPDAAIATHYAANRATILVGGYLDGITVLLFLWFAAASRSILDRVEGRRARLSMLAFGGAVAMMPGALIADAASCALAYASAGAIEPGTARALFELRVIGAAFLAFPTVAFTAGTSLVMAVVPGWGRWLFWSGVLTALALLLAGGAVLFSDGPFAPGGLYPRVVEPVWLAWVLATSLCLILRGIPVTADATLRWRTAS